MNDETRTDPKELARRAMVAAAHFAGAMMEAYSETFPEQAALMAQSGGSFAVRVSEILSTHPRASPSRQRRYSGRRSPARFRVVPSRHPTAASRSSRRISVGSRSATCCRPCLLWQGLPSLCGKCHTPIMQARSMTPAQAAPRARSRTRPT